MICEAPEWNISVLAKQSCFPALMGVPVYTMGAMATVRGVSD